MPSANANNAAPPFESAGELHDANQRLLEALNRRIGGDRSAEAERAALRAMEAAIREFLARGIASGVYIEDLKERTSCQVTLDYWASVLSHAGVAVERERLAAFDAERLPALPDEPCPFVGLDAFTERTQGYFFGREEAVAALLARLDKVPLLVVQGGSGSGKSSLVMAGALPALRARAAGSGAREAPLRIVGPFTPGNAVLERLARAVLGADADATATAAALRDDPARLVAMAGGTDAPPLVLVVDQFEEVFTLGDDRDRTAPAVGSAGQPAHDRQVLAAGLAALLAARPADRVIVTMREEFSERLDELVALRPLLSGPARFSMSAWPMGTDALKAAVEGPAAKVNLQFQPGIVDDMVQSVLRSGTTALPLLQFALRRLWDRRQRNRITWEVYRGIGGSPLKSLETFADDVYDRIRAFEEQRVEFERVMTALVRVSRLLEPYRQQVLRSRLLAPGSAQTPAVLRLLEDNDFIRVAPTGSGDDAVVEVKHEALLRNWPRYQEWIDAKREQVRQRIALSESAQRWSDGGRSPNEGLLSGWQLEEIERLRDLSELERAYVDASREAIDRARSARESELRRQERRKWLALTVAVAMVVALAALGTLALDAGLDRDREAGLRQRANAEKQIARAKEASYRGRIDHALVGALRAAAEVGSLGDVAAADPLRAQQREMLLSTLRNAADLRRLFVGEDGAVFHAVAFHPARGGALLAYGGTGGKAQVAGIDAPFAAPPIDACGAALVTAAAFEPQGRWLATGCGDGTLSVWSTDGWRRLGSANTRVFDRTLWTLAFSPDGRLIVAGGHDNQVALVTLGEDGSPIDAPPAMAGGQLPRGFVWSLAFAPGGGEFVAGDGVGTVLVCTPSSSAEWDCVPSPAYPGDAESSAQETDAIRALAYSPDGRQIAVGRWKGGAEIWGAGFAAKSQGVVDLSGEPPGPVHSLAFIEACGQRQLAIGKATGLVFRPATGAPADDALARCMPPRSTSIGDEVYALAFDAPSGLLAAATRGGYVAVVDPARTRDPLHALASTPPTRERQPVRGAIVAEAPPRAWLAVPIVPAGSTGPQGANLALVALRDGRIDAGAGTTMLAAGEAEIVRVSASASSRRLAVLGCWPEDPDEGCRAGDPHGIAVWRLGDRLDAVAPVGSPIDSSVFGALIPVRIALAPDGRRLAVAFSAGRVKRGASAEEELAWRERANQARRILLASGDELSARTWIETGLDVVREIAFSDDGRLFAAGGAAARPQPGAGVHEVRLWRVTEAELQPPSGQPLTVGPLANKVYELRFAADAQGHALLLAGGDLGVIERWDVASGRSLDALRADSRPILQIAFSRAGAAVAAADMQNVVRLWDIASWTATQLTPPNQRIESPGFIAFGGDGAWLASGASALELWDVGEGSLRHKICALLREPGQHGADSPTPLWGKDGCEAP